MLLSILSLFVSTFFILNCIITNQNPFVNYFFVPTNIQPNLKRVEREIPSNFFTASESLQVMGCCGACHWFWDRKLALFWKAPCNAIAKGDSILIDSTGQMVENSGAEESRWTF